MKALALRNQQQKEVSRVERQCKSGKRESSGQFKKIPFTHTSSSKLLVLLEKRLSLETPVHQIAYCSALVTWQKFVLQSSNLLADESTLPTCSHWCWSHENLRGWNPSADKNLEWTHYEAVEKCRCIFWESMVELWTIRWVLREKKCGSLKITDLLHGSHKRKF